MFIFYYQNDDALGYFCGIPENPSTWDLLTPLKQNATCFDDVGVFSFPDLLEYFKIHNYHSIWGV